MSYRERKIVELSEKKFAVENIMRLYKDGRIHFPQVPGRKVRVSSGKKIVSELLKVIQIGIPMPIIYASELQNGDLLILESTDRLWYLLKYIEGEFSVSMEEVSQESDTCFFGELDVRNSRLAADILRTVFIFQIIDYRTPRYQHMELGLFHERWKVEREQAIRDELYKGQEIENLKYISEKSAGIIYDDGQSDHFLRNEYMTLYMMLFWGVYNDVLGVNNNMEEQELLEVTICELGAHKDIWDHFLGVVQSCSLSDFEEIKRRNRLNAYYMHLRDIKRKAKTLGSLVCYYDMLRIKTVNADKMMDDILYNRVFINKIMSMKITVENIHYILEFGKDQFR